MTACDIVFVDDDRQVLEAYSETLQLGGLQVDPHDTVKSAIAAISRDSPIVVLTDVRMPGRDGFDFLALIRKIDDEIPVVIVTGHGDVPMALQALRSGAWDFLEKPADPIKLVETVRRALAHRKLLLENRRLRLAAVGASDLDRRIIGHSRAAMSIRRIVGQLAELDTDVLIVGETGTGKEVVARALHDFGSRARGQFVAVNCGAIPETMLESELFGHEPGAFTGARERRIGKIEHANRGTLFLDEVESMTLSAQVRLLRVLQERCLERLGSNKEISLDLRVVAATKTPLAELVRQGRFREDLSYRLDVVRVELPPLRERHGDAPLLFRHFVDLAAGRHGRPAPMLSEWLLSRLATHDWPGNVRELRNAAERHALGIDDFGARGPRPDEAGGGPLERQLEACEKEIILEALATHADKIGVTADALGVSRKTLYLKMKKLGITRETTD